MTLANIMSIAGTAPTTAYLLLTTTASVKAMNTTRTAANIKLFISRLVRRARDIQINGFVVYYEAKDLTPETWCTEEVSGVGAAYSKFASPELAVRMRMGIANLPYKNVKDLPYEGDDKIYSSIGAGV